MEGIDLLQTLPSGVEGMIMAGGILMLSFFIVMFIVVKKRWEGKVVPFFLGLLSYVIFVFVCVNLIMSAFALIPSVDMAFSYNQHAYTIVYCVVASVAFLAARVVLGNMITQR